MIDQVTRHKPLVGIILAISAASFFALSLISARISYDHGTNVQTIMLIRFLFVFVLMLIWNISRNKSLQLPVKKIARCCLLGTFYFIGIGSYLASVAYMPVSLAVLILYTFPILVILLSAFIEKRKPGLIEFLALIIAFIGLYIALDVSTTGNTKVIGLVLAIFGALGVTLNMVGSSYILKRLAFTVFSFYQATTVALLALLVIVFTGGLALPNSSTGWWAFVAMMASFIIAYLSVYSGLKIIGPVRLSTIMNLEPVMTTLFAIAILGELMTQQKLIGGSIVLTAILLAQWPQIRKVMFKPSLYEQSH